MGVKVVNFLNCLIKCTSFWYDDASVEEYLKDLYKWVQNETQGAGKPFLVTEIGAGGLYGYRNSYDSKWTEEYQAETLEKQIKDSKSQPDLLILLSLCPELIR